MRRMLIAGVALSGSVMLVQAQAQAPAFDVVSVRPAAAGPPPGFMQVGLHREDG
jgi:hypothetical protein